MKISTKVMVLVLATICLLIVNSLIFNDIRYVLLSDLAVFYISLIIVFLLFKSTERKLHHLAMAIEEMAAGNLNKRIKTSNDEVGIIGNVLNELATRLESNVALDVTKNKQIDQAKSDFVALASHQLRTPLSIVKWYIDFIVAGDAGKLTPEQKKYLTEVYTANERLIELVNNLLDVSRIDLGTFAIEPVMVDLIKLSEDALQKVKKDIITKDLVIIKQFDQLPKLSLDPRLMKLVLENLLSNSVKYTPEKGKIIFVIKKTDDNVMLKISDTGCGIPRAEQPKIFTKLFRAENVRRMESVGTGLGLYIVKAVIEKSGGKIWFESPSLDNLLYEEAKHKKITKEKLGTTFYITIPLTGMKERKGTKKLSS